MFNVSEAYKQAINARSRQDKITGTITFKSGSVINFGDESLCGDSLKIDNQCVNGDGLNFGTVYAGQLSLSILSAIDRYSLFDAEIRLAHYLKVGETWEGVPLGVYYIDNAIRVGDTIQITALDGMTALDKPIESDTNGTWWDMLLFISEECEIELAQTQEEIEALHINAPLFIYSFGRESIGTFRDALAYMCSCICAFAIFDRSGKLKICQYAAEPVWENNASNRLDGCKISDYETKYVGVKARFVEDGAYKTYSSILKNPSGDLATGMTLDLGDLPIVGGLPIDKQGVLDNILATLANIIYVPTNLSVLSNPTYDLGDLITCKNVNNSSDNVNTYVMKFTYSYRKSETIGCFGENPKLQNILSKEDKEKEDMEGMLATKNIIVQTYSNIAAYSIKQTPVKIIMFDYSVFKDCNPVFNATIPFTLDKDALVEFHLFNGFVDTGVVYTGRFFTGKNFATIHTYESATMNERRSLNVMATVLPLLEGETPVATINKQAIRASLQAQGINSKAEWDGKLDFTETFIPFERAGRNVVNFYANTLFEQQQPKQNGFAENFAPIKRVGRTVVGFGVHFEQGEIIKSNTIDITKKVEYNKEFVTIKSGAFALNTMYNYKAVDGEIDSGKMIQLDIDFTVFNAVESVVVE